MGENKDIGSFFLNLSMLRLFFEWMRLVRDRFLYVEYPLFSAPCPLPEVLSSMSCILFGLQLFDVNFLVWIIFFTCRELLCYFLLVLYIFLDDFSWSVFS